MPRATWFCIDIECSGPVPGLYDMVSLGGVRVAWDTDGWSRSAPFYVEIRPTAPRVDPGAMAVHGLDLEQLRAHGLPLHDALDQLSTWVASETRSGTRPVFVGHNAPFDWSFVNHAYVACDRTNPFGYKALDTKALAMGVLGVHWFDANKERLQQALDLPAQDTDRVHRADYDADYQARILIGLLDRRPSCADL